MNKPGKDKGYTPERLDITRRMVIASVQSNKKNAIHCISEVDVTLPRKILREHFEKTGEKVSFTAYIVRCFAHTIAVYPRMNSFIRGNKLILLHDIMISVMVEREIGGHKTPEPLVIKRLQNKTIKQIHNEIRAAQQNNENKLGSLSGSTWIRFIPTRLFKLFVKLADRNLYMAKQYGKLAVTAVGMFSKSAVWFIPHGTATVMLTVGSISKKSASAKSETTTEEHLHLTASFDHEIIDGAPAARFMQQLSETLSQAAGLEEEIVESTG